MLSLPEKSVKLFKKRFCRRDGAGCSRVVIVDDAQSRSSSSRGQQPPIKVDQVAPSHSIGLGLLLLCSFHVLPSIRASQKVLILFSSKSWVQLSHWIILEGWTETAPWRDFNKFQLLELVCKLGKWLEDLLFDIIPKHSQTLHILRVKEAESEKSSKSSSTTWNSRSSSSSSGWRVIRQRHNGKNGSGCSCNCVPFCTHLHFFTLPCTYTWTFALPCAYFALAFALRRTPSTDRD